MEHAIRALVLAPILIGGGVLVAGVAHSSMDEVNESSRDIVALSEGRLGTDPTVVSRQMGNGEVAGLASRIVPMGVPQAMTTTVLRAGSGEVAPGGSIAVPVTAEDVPPGSPLAAATIEVRYDPSVLDATACTVDPGGVFDSGICNPDFDNDGIDPDAVRFNATSVLGVSGDLLVANITFEGQGQSGDTSGLNVVISVFADPGGNPVPVSGQDGQICLTPCDTDGDRYATADELYMGTDPNKACADTSTSHDEGPPDAWPVDFDDDQRAGLQDVIFGFVTTLAPDGLNQPAAGGLERVDFNGDGFINMQDAIYGYVSNLTPDGLNTRCTP